MSFKLLINSQSRQSNSTSSSNFSISLPSPLYLNDYNYIRLAYCMFYNTLYNVNATNNNVDIKTGGSSYTATVTAGVYNANNFASALQTALTSAVSNSWTVTYNTNQLTYTIGGSSNFQLLFSSGTHASTSMWQLCGFANSNGLSGIDTTNATSTTSTQVVNFTLPMYIYINLTNICSDLIFSSDSDSFGYVVPIDTSSGSIIEYDSLSNFSQYIKRPNNLNIINILNITLTTRKGTSVNLNGSEWSMILEFLKELPSS